MCASVLDDEFLSAEKTPEFRTPLEKLGYAPAPCLVCVLHGRFSSCKTLTSPFIVVFLQMVKMCFHVLSLFSMYALLCPLSSGLLIFFKFILIVLSMNPVICYIQYVKVVIKCII